MGGDVIKLLFSPHIVIFSAAGPRLRWKEKHIRHGILKFTVLAIYFELFHALTGSSFV